MLLVRDLQNNPLFYLDGDVARDVNGKPVATRTGDDAQALTLSDAASRWMTGRKVLMDLAIGEVATAATQADFGIPTGDCVADIVSGVRYVTNDRGVWYPESASDAIKLVMPIASATGAPSEINPGFSPASFTTVGYALAAKIPRHVGGNADFDLKYRTLRRLVEALRLAREYRVATLLTTAANWPAANQIAAVAKWNGGVTANPLTDMFAALAASYMPANVLVLPEKAAQFFFQNANSQAMRDYVQSGGEMPRVLFARAKYQLTNTPVYVWSPTLPTHVALVRVDGPDSIQSTLTFRWLGADGANGEMRGGMLVRDYFDAQSDATWLVCAHNDAEVQISNQVGALITGALA